MKKIIKYFLLIVFLLDFNVQVEAKPVPPGSGEGDVAANIIFLIDSSIAFCIKKSEFINLLFCVFHIFFI